jgi:hypothetical protein
MVMWRYVSVKVLLRVWVLCFPIEERGDWRAVCQLTIILEFSNLDIQLLDLAVKKDTSFVAQGDFLVL